MITAYLPGDEPTAHPAPAENLPEYEIEDGVQYAFDNRALLRCCAFPGLRRKIGVTASAPFDHVGLKAEYVDVTRETIQVNTRGYGGYYPAGEASERVYSATEDTIADLDMVIAELSEHRARLVKSLSGSEKAN